jgi:hypothetical protein
MALKFGLDEPFGNMQGWKGIRQKEEEISGTKLQYSCIY